MRSRKNYLALALAAAALLTAAFVGCGSDSTSSTTTPPVTGSNDDPQFLEVQEQVEVLADSVVTYFQHALSACQGLANSVIPVHYTVSPGGNSQLETDYTGGWHEYDWSNLATSGVTTVTDSIQFTVNGNPRQSPLGAESVNYVHNWYFAGTTNGITDTTDGRCNFTLSGLYATNTTAQGTAEHTNSTKYVTNDSTVVRTYNTSVTLTSVSLPQAASGVSFDAFNDFDNCPLSGTIEADIVMTYKKDSGTTITTSWDIEMTLDDGVASVTITSNNTVWTYDCTVCAI